MERLIEEQAVIDCLTNTAKYYEREDADEWTKGIHYGLLHGVDNILDDVKPVEAIPKDQYEARLKADIVAILTDMKDELKHCEITGLWKANYREGFNDGVSKSLDAIQQKINTLKENNE